MQRATTDLAGGATAAVLATIAFIYWRNASAHWSSSAPGHMLGAIGIALMLWAAFGYTWRKRHATPGARAMHVAMQTHIVAGLVGPYLVILHSGLAFRGLAGVLTLLMVMVVASGVVGRAVMSAIPARVEMSDPVRSAMLDAELARLETRQAEAARRGDTDDAARDAIRRDIAEVRHRQELLHAQWTQVGSGIVARKAFSVWWLLHVPVSAALWVLAIAHVIATLYFVTLSA